MRYKNVLFLIVSLCCAFESVYPTAIIFNALKKGVQNTRCKFHQLGSKLIAHEHKHGDPCELNYVDQPEDNRLDGNDKYPAGEPNLGSTDSEPEYLNGHSYGPREQSTEGFGKGGTNIEPSSSQNTESEYAVSKATTEKYPTSIEIDIRRSENNPTTPLSSTVKITYATVPTGGGKNLGDANCNGKTSTADGCLQAM